MIKKVREWIPHVCGEAKEFIANKYNENDEISLGQLFNDVTEAGQSAVQVMWFGCFKEVPTDVRELTVNTIVNKIKEKLKVEDLNEYPEDGKFSNLKKIAIDVSLGYPCNVLYLRTIFSDEELETYKQRLSVLLGV